MPTAHILDDVCVLSVSGADAISVINNLTTNDIRRLPDSGVCETFVTNLRGWVVAHVYVCRIGDALWLYGQHLQPADVVAHIDRYVIREDVQIQDLSPSMGMLAIAGARLAEVDLGKDWEVIQQTDRLSDYRFHDESVRCLHVPFAGADAVLVCRRDVETAVRESLLAQGFNAADPDAFELARIARGWPRHGREILEKTIPQELDRDAEAISFTKGCYLGQETIARLDARGQLQKKLCVLECDPVADTGVASALQVNEQTVGQVTSLARAEGRCLALGYVKRGYFKPGTQVSLGGQPAEVIEAQA